MPKSAIALSTTLRVWQALSVMRQIKSVEVCNHCGNSVAWGSGRFVNRVPDFNDIETRIFYERKYSPGDFVCEECDINSLTGNEVNNNEIYYY